MKRSTCEGMSMRCPRRPSGDEKRGESLKKEDTVSIRFGVGEMGIGMSGVGKEHDASSLMIACVAVSVLVRMSVIARKIASPKNSMTLSSVFLRVVLKKRKKEWAIVAVILKRELISGRPAMMDRLTIRGRQGCTVSSGRSFEEGLSFWRSKVVTTSMVKIAELRFRSWSTGSGLIASGESDREEIASKARSCARRRAAPMSASVRNFTGRGFEPKKVLSCMMCLRVVSKWSIRSAVTISGRSYFPEENAVCAARRWSSILFTTALATALLEGCADRDTIKEE